MDNINLIRLQKAYGRRIPKNSFWMNVLILTLFIVMVFVSFYLESLLFDGEVSNSTLSYSYLNASFEEDTFSSLPNG